MREEELSSVFSFWDKLKKLQKELLCEETKHITVAKGEKLGCCSTSYGCFYIRKGGFKALILGDTDTETEIFRSKKDDFCILDHAYVCGQEIPGLAYQAVANADVYAIGKECFNQLIRTNASFSESVVAGMLSTIPTLIGAIEQRDYYNLDKRIINLLLNESAKQRSNVLLLTHGQIAAKIGSAREAVTRKLHDFSEEEMIQCFRGKIVLINKEKMKKRANS